VRRAGKKEVLMERLRENEPEMYAAYRDATSIRLTGIRHEKVVPPANTQTVPAALPL
jgi:hypothetical protein